MSQEVVLYQYGGFEGLPSFSPPCLKVFLALRILELPHRVVNLPNPREVAKASPTGRVPALRHGDELMAESVRIMDRLAELYPDAALWPEAAVDATEQRVWDCFATDTLYWLGFYLRWMAPTTRKLIIEAAAGPGFSWRKLAMKAYARLVFARRAKGQGVGRRAHEDVRDAYFRALDDVVTALEGGPFLRGRQRPGRGDLSIAAHVAQLTWKRDHPAIAALLGSRTGLVEHVEAVFAAAGLEAPGPPDLARATHENPAI